LGESPNRTYCASITDAQTITESLMRSRCDYWFCQRRKVLAPGEDTGWAVSGEPLAWSRGSEIMAAGL
jgi:hypothetical protein